MSHKHKKKIFQKTSTPLPARVEKALAENRTQQALELAKTLHKQEPSPANKELLKRATLARSRDLAIHGYTRDAATVLQNAIHLDSQPEFLAEIAQGMANGGDLAGARKLHDQIADPSLQARVMAHIVDEALRHELLGRQHLPEALHHQFDLTLQAFVHVEKGEDEAAREKLQGIGLQSPFLEWKLFLRGLIGYYNNEDDRAIENWSRLDPNRWPFRLAAPLRFTFDQAFAQSQPVETQNVLQQQNTRLNNSNLHQHLRTIQRTILHEQQLPQAFRAAEAALPQLRNEAPQLVPRLASCFYWAIIHHGVPEDMGRYRRIFGKPVDDPELARLEALALEVRGDFADAHRFWQRFEKSVAGSRAWPEEHKAHVRALIWAHMGHNADNIPEFGDDLDSPFLPPFRLRPKSLKPGPEECFEEALKLVPDQKTTYQALIEHYLKKEKFQKAEKTARRLLQYFPQDVNALQLVGDLSMQAEKFGEALDFYQRAMSVNPLDPRIRGKVANAHSYHARGLAEGGHFDEARQEYQAALAIDDRREKYPTYCKWAACEFKAGDAAKAQELLEKAYGEKDSRLAVVFSMLIETIRFKLNKLKKQFNDEFNGLLAEPPTGATASALALTSAQHRLAGVKYHGQQTHEKKIRSYLEKAVQADFTEEQLQQICSALESLKLSNLQHTYIRLGQKQFPKNPYFFLAEAQYQFGRSRTYYYNGYQATEALRKARELNQALPRGDRQEEIAKQIQECEKIIQELNPFSSMFSNIFDSMPFDPFSEEEEFEEDEEGLF